LKPRDGRLAPLIVQRAPNHGSQTDGITWLRADLKNITPLSIELVYWCIESILPEMAQQQPTRGKGLQRLPDGRGGFAGALNLPHAGRVFMNREWREEYFGEKWRPVYWRYPLACLGLLVLVSFIPPSLLSHGAFLTLHSYANLDRWRANIEMVGSMILCSTDSGAIP
jgi:hypothetical protein